MSGQLRKRLLQQRIILFVGILFSITSIYAKTTPPEPGNSFPSDSAKVYQYTQRALELINFSLDKSLEFAIRAREIADSSGNQYLQAEALNRLGTVYYSYKNYKKAMDYLEESLTLRFQVHDSAGIASTLVNIGVLYHVLGNEDKAIEYTQKSLEIRERLGENENAGAIYNNLFVYYTIKKDYAEALKYAQKALALYKKQGDGAGMSDIYVNLGELYYQQKNFPRAYEYFKKAKQHAVNLHDVSRIININNSYITALLDENKTAIAWPLIEESIPLAENYKEPEGLKLLYEQIARYYEITENFPLACSYLARYQNASDSLQVTEQREKILQQQIKFNATFADQQIRQMKQKKSLQQLDAESNSKIFFMLALLGIFLFILIAILIAVLKWVSKNERILQEQNQMLENTNKRLQESEDKLKKEIQARDKFFSIIAHDIINPFQPLLGLSELLVTDIDKFKDHEIKKYSQLIHESATRIFRLLEDLLYWTQSQTDKLAYHPQNFNLNKAVRESVENCRHQAENKKIKIQVDIDESLKAFGDIELFKGTLRNLVNNAIKFTHEKGNIRISARKIRSEVEVTVEDNGIGISEERLKNLFNIETIRSTKGTAKEEGTGLGLLLCKEFVEKNNGKIWAESQKDKGTIFYFTLPAAKEK